MIITAGEFYRLKNGSRVAIAEASDTTITYVTRKEQCRPREMDRAEFEEAIEAKIDSMRDDTTV